MSRLSNVSIATGALLSLWIGAASPVWSDDALYEAAPPSDAVFLRWLDGSGTPAGLGVAVVAAEGMGAAFGHFPASAAPGLVAGAHLSVVTGADGQPRLVEEPARDAVGKVHLVLVNALEAPVRLVVADGGPEVIGATAPLTSGLRAVNPVSARLAVEAAGSGETLGTMDLRLQRGQDITILVSAGDVQVIPDGFGAGSLLP